MIHGFVQDKARLELDLHWSAFRALEVGAVEDEIAEVLLATQNLTPAVPELADQ